MNIENRINDFTTGFQSEIDNYVKEKIKSVFKDQYQDFVPIVTASIEEVCKRLFDAIKKVANTNKESFSCQTTLNDSCLDSATLHLISNIFQKKFGLLSDFNLYTNRKGLNSLNSELLPCGYLFDFSCYWTPKTRPFCFESIPLRYTYNPEIKNVFLLDCAKKRIETDVTIISKTAEKISVHSLFLKTSCEFFKSMLNSSMKEGNTKTITLEGSTEAVNNLVQFIYQGNIQASSHQNLELLIELLVISHQYQIPDLFNHCTDLILQLLNRKTELSPDTIVNLINSAYYYQLPEFIEPSLKAAERLKKSDNASSSASSAQSPDADSVLDWKKISKDHYVELFSFAIKYSVPGIEQELNLLINHFIKNS